MRACGAGKLNPGLFNRERRSCRNGRRTRSLDVLLPALYLRGISTGDFQEVLTALLGKDAPNLSPAVIARLKENGKTNTSSGKSAICRLGAMLMSGPTASINQFVSS